MIPFLLGPRTGGTTVRTRLSLALVVLPALCAAALDFPDNIGQVKLRDAMWQDLPSQVYSVFVGPKDRVWYQLCHPAKKEDLDLVRTIIRREFSKPTPQLFGVRPALFEPGGRVWFVPRSGKVLLGYDGKALIEKNMDGDHFIIGNCPNHGRVYRAGYNLFAAETAFFLESHGVLSFSEGEWSYRQMRAERINLWGTSRYPGICLEPDGKGVTVFMPTKDTASLWRWRAGKWKEVDLGDTVDRVNLVSVAPGRDGIWLFTKTGIAFHSHKTGIDEEFNRLLRKLGDSSHRTREDATREMIQLGSSVIPHAEAARKKTSDPEVGVRLKEVIDAVTPGPEKPSAFGPYLLKDPELALHDHHATTYVTAADIRHRGGSLGPGLVIANPDGTFQAFPGSRIPRRWRSNFSDASGPLVLEPGKLIWLPACTGGEGPGLLDIAEKQLTTLMPEYQVRWLHAVKSDGTVFAGRRGASQSWGRPIMRFEPDAPDDRNILESTRIEIKDCSRLCVTSDGTIWSETAAQGVAGFDGRKWTPLGEATIGAVRDFLPGADGSLILTTGRGACVLVTRDKVMRASSIRNLISEHAKDIARLFKGGANTQWLSIVPDKHGNIWLRQTRAVSVFSNQRWTDASDALKGAGSRLGKVEYLGECAGGSKVYMTDFMLVHDRGSSHFGRVVEGKPQFTKAPHTCERSAMHLSVRDDDDGLWIPGSVRGGGGTCDFISGQLAIRIAEDDTMQQLNNEGWARLKDRSGNVWLGRIRGESLDRFNIWRNGKVVHSVTVPGVLEQFGGLFSDRPGSVFVWTKLGLRRLIARDPANPAKYSLGKLYHVKDLEGAPRVMRHSRRGLFAFTTFSDRGGPRRHYLCLVKVPPADGKADG